MPEQHKINNLFFAVLVKRKPIERQRLKISINLRVSCDFKGKIKAMMLFESCLQITRKQCEKDLHCDFTPDSRKTSEGASSAHPEPRYKGAHPVQTARGCAASVYGLLQPSSLKFCSKKSKTYHKNLYRDPHFYFATDPTGAAGLDMNRPIIRPDTRHRPETPVVGRSTGFERLPVRSKPRNIRSLCPQMTTYLRHTLLSSIILPSLSLS